MKRALVLLALATLSTGSARAAPRQKVAVLDVRAVQGVSPGTATILTAIIAGDTQSAGYDVLSQADIGALIGLERQKKMLGCGDDFSCLAEIGGALGAEYVLSTQVGQIGSRFHLSLQLLDARRASVIARVSTFSDTTEDALAATTQRAVAQALSAARDRASVVPAAATATSAAVATRPPGPTAPSSTTATGAPRTSSLAGRPLYVELRGGIGWDRTPAPPTGGGLELFEAPALGLRVGVQLSRTWAVEAGAAWRHLRHTTGTLSFEDSVFLPVSLPVEDDVRALLLGASAVYSPRPLRWISFAGELGVARVAAEHTVRSDPSSFYSYDPVKKTWTGVVPRVGLELRADVPVRWVTIGLRAGMDVAKVGAQEMVRDPFSPFGDEPNVPWMKAGWIVTFPVDLSLRYVF